MVCQGEVNNMFWANFLDFECWGGGGTEKSVKFCKLGILFEGIVFLKYTWNKYTNMQEYK